MNKTTVDQAFAKAVKDGLSSHSKTLPCKYFYDEKGDRLFQQIMEMEEYYLTNCEFDILETHHQTLLESFAKGHHFKLIEFGAGDGYKTKILLRHFTEKQVDFQYIPIDISQNVLDLLLNDLKLQMPQLNTVGINDDYFHALAELNAHEQAAKVILFLGSNIGNFSQQEAIVFLKHIKDFLNPEDLLLIGMDLKKDPTVILNAYNDPHGITRDFNLNLLARINRELGGEFDLEKFRHWQIYDPLTGLASSYLISTEEQTVPIAALDTAFHFRAWEPVHTEISKKYDLAEIEYLAQSARFSVRQHFFDHRQYFVDSLWAVAD